MESETPSALNRRIIQNFMDIIALKHLEKNQPLSGYDMIKYFHKRFHILLSPGTIYSTLYSLERQHLVQGYMNNGKRVYKLTKQGEKVLTNICTAKSNIQSFLSDVFSKA